MLICSITGLPCQAPVICTVCGAVYEESAARKRVEDRKQCIYGHDLSADTIIPVKSGSIQSEEGIDKVRIQALSGMLDYFGSLISSLASDNYGLRKDLAARDAENKEDSAYPPMEQTPSPRDRDSTSVNIFILQSIRGHTAQLAAIRKAFLLPPDICLEESAVEALGLKLKAHLAALESPFFAALAIASKDSAFSVSGEIVPTGAWPIYHPPHMNSNQLAIRHVAIACKLVLRLDMVEYMADNTLLLLVESRYVHNVQVSTLSLSEILPYLSLETPPATLVSSMKIHHVHPYGVCLYTDGQSQGLLTVLALEQKYMKNLNHLQIAFSSSSLFSLLAAPNPPALHVTYKGVFMGIHPDGRLLVTYVCEDTTLLIYDICQLAYEFGPLLQYKLDKPPPSKIRWDASGQHITLVHNDNTLSQLFLSKGTLISSYN